MSYPTSNGKNGEIYTISEGVKVIPTKTGYWTLDIYEKGETHRRNFEKGEEGLKRAILAAELYVARTGQASSKVAEKEKLVTVSSAAAEWLKSNRSRWSHGTNERYVSAVSDFVNPVLGPMEILQVKRNHVKDFLADILQIRAPKTVELIHAIVSGIFTEAIDRGYTEENPASGLLKKILPPKQKRNRSEPDPFNREDLARMLGAAWQHLNPSMALVLEVMAYSGMRLGESLAMHRSHLDISNCQYMVTETFRRGRYGTPKTGRRLIDLPEPLVARIESHIKKLRKEAMKTGGDVGYLFLDITQRMVQNNLKRLCRLAKLRRRNPHDLRHTYATLLLTDHYSPAYVQKQLGHHSITMTVDIYGHWMPGEGKKDLGATLYVRKLEPVPRVDQAESS